MEESKVVSLADIETPGTPTATPAPNRVSKRKPGEKRGGRREGTGRPKSETAVALNSVMTLDGGNSREVLKQNKKAEYTNLTVLGKKLVSIIKEAQQKVNLDKATAKDLKELYIAYGISIDKKRDLEAAIKEDDTQGIHDDNDLDGQQKQLVGELMMLVKKHAPRPVVITQGVVEKPEEGV